ncbi:MAG: hypothetical protein HYV27_24495 [Candidatus Hydrogenedentes bacterium]|nr:hypothetical protein [Candidatus Hydrogenedentota bacterium]
MLRDPAVAGLLLSLLFAVAGVTGLLWGVRRRKRLSQGPGLSQVECTHCLEPMSIERRRLVALSPVEKGLVIRSKPEWVGKAMGEYVCPNCGSTHTFGIQGRKLTLLGTNFYEPQTISVQCSECRNRLEEPQWAPEGAQPSWQGVRERQPRVGVRCPFCRAVTCVSCCADYTRNRTADKSLKCPRCDRGPLTQYLFPQRDMRNL